MDNLPLMKLFTLAVGVPLALGVCEFTVLYLVRRAIAWARQKSHSTTVAAPASSR